MFLGNMGVHIRSVETSQNDRKTSPLSADYIPITSKMEC